MLAVGVVVQALAVVVVHLWWGSGFCDSVGAWSCGGSAI